VVENSRRASHARVSLDLRAAPAVCCAPFVPPD
jgi:hypothetical protein